MKGQPTEYFVIFKRQTSDLSIRLLDLTSQFPEQRIYFSMRLLDLTSQCPEQRIYFCEVIGSHFTMPWTKNVLLWGYWILLHNALNKKCTCVRLLDLTSQCPEQRIYYCEVIGSYFTMPWTKSILLWGYWISLHNVLNKEYTSPWGHQILLHN